MKQLFIILILIIIGANNVSVSAQRARAAKAVYRMSRAESRAHSIRTAVGSAAANAVLRASRQNTTVCSSNTQYQNVMTRTLPAIDTTHRTLIVHGAYAPDLAKEGMLKRLYVDAQADPSDPLSRVYAEIQRVAGNSRVEICSDYVAVSMPGSLNAHSLLFYTHITSDCGVKILLSVIEEITESHLRHGNLYFVFTKTKSNIIGNGLSFFPDVVFNVNGVESLRCRADSSLVERAAATIGMTIKSTAVGNISNGNQAVQICLDEIEAPKLCLAIVSEVHRRPEW